MVVIKKSFDEIAVLGRLELDHFLKRYKSERRRRKMSRFYEAALQEAAELVAPQAVLDQFDASLLPSFKPWLPPRSIAVVLAVCTLGPNVDERTRFLSDHDIVAAAVLEEVMLITLVGLTNLIHRHVREEQAAQGIKAGPPYRPGVGRWPIETQTTVFTHLPGDAAGVTLTPELFMVPLQSTSLIIPLIDRRPIESKKTLTST